jgi:hypothetical protein
LTGCGVGEANTTTTLSVGNSIGCILVSIRSWLVVVTGLAEQQLHKQKEKVKQTKQIKQFFISIKNQRSS